MSEQMRKEFEEYRDLRNAQLKAEGASDKFMINNAHWATWQASRQSLVVELSDGDVDTAAYEYKIAQQLMKLGVQVVDFDGRPYK
jgi:uncharacterized lipoprotein YmbA